VKPRDIFREWMKGCGNTRCGLAGGPLTPWKCDECTAAMMSALERAFAAEELDQQTAELEAVPEPSTEPDATSIILEPVPRLEFSAKVRELENAETANTGLRVQLHITQQMLAGANAAITLLAKGAGQTKLQHLQEQAQAAAENAKLRAELEDLKRNVAG